MTQPSTTTTDAAVDITATAARTLTDTIRAATGQLCHLLRDAYEHRAHHALGYTRWEDYVEAEFGMKRAHSYRLLEQSRVLTELEAIAPTSDPDGQVVLAEREIRDIAPRLPEVKAAITARAAESPDMPYPEVVRRVVADVRAHPTAPVPPVPPEPLRAVDPATGVIDEPTPDAAVVDGGEPAVIGALQEIPLMMRRLPEGLLFEVIDPGHPLQGWCGMAPNSGMLAAVMHDLLTEAKRCEDDLRSGTFYAPLAEVVSGRPRESTYDPADYIPLPDGRWLTPSGRKYAPDSWVMRQVLAKRVLAGLPTVYTHGDVDAEVVEL